MTSLQRREVLFREVQENYRGVSAKEKKCGSCLPRSHAAALAEKRGEIEVLDAKCEAWCDRPSRHIRASRRHHSAYSYIQGSTHSPLSGFILHVHGSVATAAASAVLSVPVKPTKSLLRRTSLRSRGNFNDHHPPLQRAPRTFFPIDI